MKIIKPNVKEITLVEPGKRIEYAGRVCYHSDSKINDISYIKFIQNIIKSGHCSVIEHERLCMGIDLSKPFPYLVGINQSNHMKFFNITNDEKLNYCYISGDIRAWYEATKNQPKDAGYYKILNRMYPFIFNEKKDYIDAPTEIKYIPVESIPYEFKDMHDNHTFEIVCSRSCSHQLVRHRSLSVSQESQRYCAYNTDKFGHSISFILPEPEKISESFNEIVSKEYQNAENAYFNLTDNGVRPEDARAVLPNGTATKIVLSGTTNDWKAFIKLRSDSHAQKEIREISNTIRDYLKLS